ncbi:MAG: dTMP kinase [Rhodothermales bacterium]|nr:dTMP kinase [Rhodothermales bacterium]MBO6779122.1 dTMP kinase [Rhodothermales bacterium]
MRLITFEGLDGSGKSTQARLLAEWLREAGYTVEMVREPGGTDISERVREMLLDPRNEISPFAELLLFSAARAQLVAERVQPLLDEGTLVLCDRFFDSTTAYQGFGRGLADPGWLDGFHRKVTGGLVPHRTYLIRITPVEAAHRRRGRSEDDRMEAAGEPFHERVAEGYDWLAAREPDRVHVLDGTRAIELIATDIRRDMRQMLDGGTAGRS